MMEMANHLELDIQAGDLFVSMNEPLRHAIYNYSLALKNSEVEKESDHSSDFFNGFSSSGPKSMNKLEFPSNPVNNPRIRTNVSLFDDRIKGKDQSFGVDGAFDSSASLGQAGPGERKDGLAYHHAETCWHALRPQCHGR